MTDQDEANHEADLRELRGHVFGDGHTDEADVDSGADADSDADRKKQGNHVPREGTTATIAPADDNRQFARELFSDQP